MYCSFNSKYNKYSKKLILSFFWFKNNYDSIEGRVFERSCEEKDLNSIHKKFLIYSIKKLKNSEQKLTFIIPKVNEHNEFVGMHHIPHNYVSMLIKDSELDAHNNKIILKDYEQVEYMHKDFMPTLFFTISKYTKELLNSEFKIEDNSFFNFSHVEPYYVDISKEPKSEDFFDKFITVFTDAAFDNQINAYGWGAWIKDSETTRIGGYGFTQDNNHSEMYAILHAIEYLVKKHLDKNNNFSLKEKIISLTTDSDKCISLMHKLNPNDRFSKALSEVKSKLIQYESKYHFEIKFKGIKSHLSNKNSKQAVNNWCDKEAKKQLNILREIVSNGKDSYTPNPKETYPKVKKNNKKRKKYLKKTSKEKNQINS